MSRSSGNRVVGEEVPGGVSTDDEGGGGFTGVSSIRVEGGEDVGLMASNFAFASFENSSDIVPVRWRTNQITATNTMARIMITMTAGKSVSAPISSGNNSET